MHPEYGSMDQEILIHGSWINVFRNLDPNGYPLDQEMDRDLTKSRSIANGSRFHKMDQDPLSIFGHFLHFLTFQLVLAHISESGATSIHLKWIEIVPLGNGFQ